MSQPTANSSISLNGRYWGTDKNIYDAFATIRETALSRRVKMRIASKPIRVGRKPDYVRQSPMRVNVKGRVVERPRLQGQLTPLTDVFALCTKNNLRNRCNLRINSSICGYAALCNLSDLWTYFRILGGRDRVLALLFVSLGAESDDTR